ncbi:MAG: 50S ribosomal protein L11 methyltransferase [Pseudomonadota bacterium]
MLYKAIWTGPRAAMDAAMTFFTEIEETARTVGLQKHDATADDDASTWSVEVYFEDAPDMIALTGAMAAFDPALSNLAPGVVDEVPDKDWVAHALEGLGVVEAGRFVLYGAHDADKLPDDEGLIPIRIDANAAFGTGHHPTTAGCLTLLDRFGGFAPKSILDLGCGSAVLAIAAAKLWDRDILATDIDADSIDIARENARLNGASDHITAVVADGFDHEAINRAAPFDFVFANILAGPLKEFAPSMADHVRKNGRIMLAGLMAEQESGVLEAYEQAGFRLLNRLDHETWPVLLLVRQ